MLRIGILGAAGIAPNAIIRPAIRRNDVEIVAVAARSGSRARAYADEHRIPVAYEGYERLLADDAIELVYVALPPSEHAAWSIAALEAGKHVLCEKPIAMNASEARAMVEATKRTGYRLIEAFHDRYHPLSARVSQIAGSGRLGRIGSVAADFSAENLFDAASIRHDPAAGGGALMDLGCYPVHWVRTLFGAEPEVVEATGTPNPLGTDESISATLRFPSGAIAVVTASMAAGLPLSSTLDVRGDDGTLHVKNMVFPSSGHSIRETIDGVVRETTVEGQTTYDHQLDALVAALASGEPLATEGADIIGNMTVIDAIYAKAGFPAR